MLFTVLALIFMLIFTGLFTNLFGLFWLPVHIKVVVWATENKVVYCVVVGIVKPLKLVVLSLVYKSSNIPNRGLENYIWTGFSGDLGCFVTVLVHFVAVLALLWAGLALFGNCIDAVWAVLGLLWHYFWLLMIFWQFWCCIGTVLIQFYHCFEPLMMSQLWAVWHCWIFDDILALFWTFKTMYWHSFRLL